MAKTLPTKDYPLATPNWLPGLQRLWPFSSSRPTNNARRVARGNNGQVGETQRNNGFFATGQAKSAISNKNPRIFHITHVDNLPGSVMLFAVGKGHDDYGGGQTDIVHLVSTVDQAATLGRRWAFTDRHAELRHALFYNQLSDLGEVPWPVMAKGYWKEEKEERQLETALKFLKTKPESTGDLDLVSELIEGFETPVWYGTSGNGPLGNDPRQRRNRC